jgi:hypothetical protein
VLVEIVFAATDRDHRCAGLGDHPGDRGADAATGRAGHHDDAVTQTEEIIEHWMDSPYVLSGQNSMMRMIENMILCTWLRVKWF